MAKKKSTSKQRAPAKSEPVVRSARQIKKILLKAQAETGETAIDICKKIAEFGRRFATQLREPFDVENDEFLEMQVKTADFRELIEMLSAVDDWCADLREVDSVDECVDAIVKHQST